MKRWLIGLMVCCSSMVAIAEEYLWGRVSKSGLPNKDDAIYAYEKSEDSDLGNYFQDMKNFLALTQLKQNQNAAALRATPPPSVETTIFSGGKLSLAEGAQKPDYDSLMTFFTKWNLLTGTDQGAIAAATENSVVGRHYDYYCNTEEANLELCVNPQWATPVDLEASSLFAQDSFADRGIKDAAAEYIRNLTNIKPVPLLPASDMFITDPETQEKFFSDQAEDILFLRFKQQTLLSLAQFSLTKLYTERLPYNTTTTDPNIPAELQNASELGTLNNDIKRRYENPDWYTKMNGLPAEGILREMANMMALQLALNYRQYEQASRIEAMTAAQIAIQVGEMAQ